MGKEIGILLLLLISDTVLDITYHMLPMHTRTHTHIYIYREKCVRLFISYGTET